MSHDTYDSPTDRTPRPEHLHVCRDTTPGVHPTDGDGIVWWLPIIGPTATVLAQTLARYTPAEGATWNLAELAVRIGLSGNQSKLWTSLNRLDQFGVAHFHATDVMTIRMSLPALSDRQLSRLPADMVDAYQHAPVTV